MEISKIIAILITGIIIGAMVVRSDEWTDFLGKFFGMSILMVLGYYLLK